MSNIISFGAIMGLAIAIPCYFAGLFAYATTVAYNILFWKDHDVDFVPIWLAYSFLFSLAMYHKDFLHFLQSLWAQHSRIRQG